MRQVAIVTDPEIATVDRLSSLAPAVSNGTYTITTQYSVATEDELNQAGTVYPKWLAPYSSLPAEGYRRPDVLDRIHQLAVEVTTRSQRPNALPESEGNRDLPARNTNTR